MRLRSCVAIELALGALMLGAFSGAVALGVHEVRTQLSLGREASAAAYPSAPAPRVAARSSIAAVQPARTALPPPVDPTPSEPKPWVGTFLGQSDAVLLEPVLTSPIREIKLNRGGSSLSLRIDFENGARAACKPAQVHPHSQPRREVAAYRVNRLLGLSSVPPSVGRRFHMSDIVDHLRPGQSGRARVLAEMIAGDDGTVVAELSWWIPVLEPARVDGFDIDSTDGVVTWKRYLAAGAPVPEDKLPMVAQVSDLVLFDFVIDNVDRWSGGNVKASEDGRVLYFMDNTMSFGNDLNAHTKVRTYLERVQKFSRGLVSRLRDLEPEALREAITRDIEPFPELLTQEEIDALLARRDYAISYIDSLIDKHGADAVLAFP